MALVLIVTMNYTRLQTIIKSKDALTLVATWVLINHSSENALMQNVFYQQHHRHITLSYFACFIISKSKCHVHAQKQTLNVMKVSRNCILILTSVIRLITWRRRFLKQNWHVYLVNTSLYLLAIVKYLVTTAWMDYRKTKRRRSTVQRVWKMTILKCLYG